MVFMRMELNISLNPNERIQGQSLIDMATSAHNYRLVEYMVTLPSLQISPEILAKFTGFDH